MRTEPQPVRATAVAICVCICTYRRPDLLGRLLHALAEQGTEQVLRYSIVVVDNDRMESARSTVESFARSSAVPVRYHVEPEQNIALARNKAVASADGDFIALIDDDEIPGKRWLLALYEAIERHKADGVLGPVIPHFDTPPPQWIVKGRFFERPTHVTGTVLDWNHTRTGNALLRQAIFDARHPPFDARFGSGGEDRDFFRRQIQRGRVFVWCNEAPVFETVPPARWKRTTLLKRALLRGRMALNSAQSTPASIATSTVAVALYTAGLPLFLLLGQHVFMKFLIKDCDHLGKLLAFAGIDVVKEKYVG